MKRISYTALLLMLIFLTYEKSESSEQFDIYLEAITIEGLPGVQSYAFGQFEDYWVIIGGRLDGLHRRQPFLSFSYDGNNKEIIVIDIKNKVFYTSDLNKLETNISEQLSSTNLQFFQSENFLYLTGGYGFSPNAGNHITYPALIAVDVEGLINAVISKSNIQPFFRRYEDDFFAVTGGYLQKLDDIYYLIGGHNFTGRYNPMNGSSFVQKYTDQIRKFTINDDGQNLNIQQIEVITHSNTFHRRDYNVVPQIMPDGSYAMTAFSGVFRQEADIPYLSSVDINSDSYRVVDNFAQYLNHYHCAHVPIYDESENMMHTIFFGGIAQYFYKDDILTQDDNVPFVNTIGRVTRYSNGTMREFKFLNDMPGLLGASAEFITSQNVSVYPNHVIKMDSLESDSTLIGYIFGGIRSTEPNIFFNDDGTKSNANANIYAVYLIKQNPNSISIYNEQSAGSLKMQLFPMPGNGEINLAITLEKSEQIKLYIRDLTGRLMVSDNVNISGKGRYLVSKYYPELVNAGTYLITIETETDSCTQKYIFKQ